MSLHAVNRIIIGVFIITGWITTFGLIYHLSYTCGYRDGILDMSTNMHIACSTQVVLQFTNGGQTYVCSPIERM